MDHLNSAKGTYFLYDDDCGVCTKASKIFGRLLGKKVKVLPMHLPHVEKEGMNKIPLDYWKSFHIIQDGFWYTEGEAILQLSSLLPLGGLTRKIASVPPIYNLLISILKSMQHRRKVECSIQNLQKGISSYN